MLRRAGRRRLTERKVRAATRVGAAIVDLAQISSERYDETGARQSMREDAMFVNQICTHGVVTCSPGTSAIEIARILRDRHVGDVVVVDDSDGRPRPVGLVTDRDLVVKVMARNADPELFTAADLAAEAPEMALDCEFAFDAICRMRAKGVRRLPVVDSKGYLVGLLSADDVARFLAGELSELARVAPRQIQREEATFAALSAG